MFSKDKAVSAGLAVVVVLVIVVAAVTGTYLVLNKRPSSIGGSTSSTTVATKSSSSVTRTSTTTTQNGIICNEGSTTTFSTSSTISNNTTFTPPLQPVLVMAPYCKAMLFVSGPNDISGDMNSILSTTIGTWVGEPQHTGINPLPNPNIVNISVTLPIIPSNNQSVIMNYNYTIIITTSSSIGFYVWRTPYNGYIPLVVGYSASQVNMTKEYPYFSQPIPSDGGALTLDAISGAFVEYVNSPYPIG